MRLDEVRRRGYAGLRSYAESDEERPQQEEQDGQPADNHGGDGEPTACPFPISVERRAERHQGPDKEHARTDRPERVSSAVDVHQSSAGQGHERQRQRDNPGFHRSLMPPPKVLALPGV